MGGGGLKSVPAVDDLTELRETALRYRALVEQSLIGVFVLEDERLASSNARFDGVFGYGPGESPAGRPLADLVALQDRERVAAWLAGLRQGEGQDSPLTFAALRLDGSVIEVEASGRRIRDHGHPVVVGMLADVTDRVRAERELHQLAFSDPLTGLPNRALLLDRVTQAIHHARRYGEGFALMLLDLDGFKDVNDRRGHDAGDTVLKVVAGRLLECVRESDTVARMGGDEFTVLLNRATQRAALERIAAKVVATVAEPVDLGDGSVRVGASVGLALCPAHGFTVDALLAAADGAMYASKERGKGCYTFADDSTPLASSRDVPLIAWSADHEVGVAVIDGQHREMVSRVNALARAIAAAEETATVRVLLADLTGYTAMHFATEEALMATHAVGGADVHREQHQRLLGELSALDRRLESDGLSRTLVGIKEWLLAHIHHADRVLARALNARGVT
ncbi:MAG: bacteriohemerythrin [Gammaproteobacteria bacterium]|jgi:diguanylate cyclase (GGDEF)-like protein/hemerythrin-like metal-binding protein/PAS domain S-box-containing protein|nr:bacteriohemerythrin [Gammaproteobacteria bacterium]